MLLAEWVSIRDKIVRKMKFNLKDARCASTISTLFMILFFLAAAYKVLAPSIAAAMILALAIVIVLHQLVIKPLRVKRSRCQRKTSHS